MANKINKWMPIPPGGPSGPFWGVCAQSGLIIALRMGDEKWTNFLVQAGNAAQCDFDIVHEAGIKLKGILARDFPRKPPDKMPVDEGAEDYTIRAVMEALFGEYFTDKT